MIRQLISIRQVNVQSDAIALCVIVRCKKEMSTSLIITSNIFLIFVWLNRAKKLISLKNKKRNFQTDREIRDNYVINDKIKMSLDLLMDGA